MRVWWQISTCVLNLHGQRLVSRVFRGIVEGYAERDGEAGARIRGQRASHQHSCDS